MVMDGFLKNNSSSVLKQWSKFLERRSEEMSTHTMAHWEQVERLGFPTQKHENWKYTPIGVLLDKKFTKPLIKTLTSAQCNELALKIEAYRLVFIDGHFSMSLSDNYLGNYSFRLSTSATEREMTSPIQSEIFLHLTESLSKEMSVISLPSGKTTDRPLYLLHISTGNKKEGHVNTVHHRHHLLIDTGSKAEVIEHYVSLDHAEHFTGTRLTASVADNANLLHCKLAFENQSSYHFSHNDLLIGSNARVKSDSFLLGAGLTRHNMSAKFNGVGSNITMNSLSLPISKEVCDVRTYLEHNYEHCKSQQLHKTVVFDGAKAVFNGMIKVAKHAIKTDGQMINHNLLLGKTAEVDIKPQLEIYANDVKCKHGATVGQIDVAKLFYMQARGIDQNTAKKMIILAFSSELTENITNKALQEWLLGCITYRLKRGRLYELPH